MGKETLYNFDYTSPTQITRELYQDVGSGTLQVGNTRRGFKGSTDFEIWDAATGGTQLTENTDYTLGGLDSRATAAAGYNVYSNFTVDTVGYQTGNIYITYKIVGTYPNAGDTNQLRQATGVRRNAVTNGDMVIAQAGTSFAAIADQTYTVDMWEYIKSGTMVHTVTQDTTVPSSEVFKYSSKLDVTTADSSIAAGDYCGYRTKIEGYDFAPYVGQTATLGFWARDTKTGIHCVAFKNSGSDRTYVAEYTIDVADTEEFKTITLDFDYSGGTWNYTNGVGLEIVFVLAAGTTYQTTADAWQTGDYLATSNQVNSCDNTANNFFITGVSLNIGSEALSFEHIDFKIKLEKCQRYFEKTFDYGTAPAQDAGYQGSLMAVAADIANSDLIFSWLYKTSKRSNAGTTTSYNPEAASSGCCLNTTGDYAVTKISGDENSVVYRNNAAVTVGGAYQLHLTVDNRL